MPADTAMCKPTVVFAMHRAPHRPYNSFVAPISTPFFFAPPFATLMVAQAMWTMPGGNKNEDVSFLVRDIGLQITFGLWMRRGPPHLMFTPCIEKPCVHCIALQAATGRRSRGSLVAPI